MVISVSAITSSHLFISSEWKVLNFGICCLTRCRPYVYQVVPYLVYDHGRCLDVCSTRVTTKNNTSGECSGSLRVNFGCCIFRLYSLAMFWDLFCIPIQNYLQSNDVSELLSTELYLAHDCPEGVLPCNVWPYVLPTFFMFLIYFSSISTHTN